MTRLASIFLFVVYTPVGFYALYKAFGIAAPVQDAGHAFWAGVGLISLLIVGMAIFYLIRTTRPVNNP